MAKRRTISAFLPCFNDAGTIASLVMEALVVLRELASDDEVIVVENGSFRRARGASQFFRVSRLIRVLVSRVKLWWWLRVQTAPGSPSPLPAPLPPGAPRPVRG